MRVARGVITLSGKTVTALDSLWWQADTGRTLKGRWVRQSPDAGEKVTYPYAAELTACGKYGADGARITTKGWGADQPIQENTTADGRALNRRVEIVLAR